MATIPLLPYDQEATEDEIKDYSQLVGSLTYSSVITRADTAFTTKSLAEHLTNPGPDHFNAAQRCFDYLEDTKYLALQLGGEASLNLEFSASSDASFADDIQTRRSTEKQLYKLFGGVIDWSSVT